jgi:hypothetical protein
MTDKSSGDFLRALAASNGEITSCFTIGCNLASYRHASMFFMLKFGNQDRLDKFHALGYETAKPERIVS